MKPWISRATRFTKALLSVALLAAGASQAGGQVVYTSVNAAIGNNSSLNMNLGGGAAEGVFTFTYNPGSSSVVFDAPAGSDLVFNSFNGNSTAPVKIAFGATIDAGAFSIPAEPAIADLEFYSTNLSYWISSTPGTITRAYIAFHTDINDDNNTYYGWLDLEITTDATTPGQIASNGVFIHGFAYQSTPEAALTAGAIPEPSTCAAIFGGLALAGVIIRRLRPGLSIPFTPAPRL